MPDAAAIEALHRELMASWNGRDADAFGRLFTAEGTIIGFDGSSVAGIDGIREHLRGIFADHDTATYVWIVREVRQLGSMVGLLRADVGMVPPGGDDIVQEANAVQSMVAVDTSDGLRIAHFQNTPAALHGRPGDAAQLTDELRAALRRSRGAS